MNTFAVVVKPGRVLPLSRACLMLFLISTVLIVGDTASSAHTPHDNIEAIAISPSYAKNRTVFVVSAGKLLRSSNRGKSWTTLVVGLPRPAENGQSLSGIAIARSNEKRMYISSRVGGMFRSDDAGHSWEIVNSGLNTTDMSHVLVSPEGHDLVLSTGSFGGLYRTTDGARTWAQVPGIGRVLASAFLSKSGAVVGDSEGQVSVSDDGGATWIRASADTGRSAVKSIATTPDSSQVFLGTEAGKLFVSSDRGHTFKPIGSGLPEEAINGIAPSSKFSSNKRLWISLATDGAYRSSDGGNTWKRQGTGLTTDVQADDIKVAQFEDIHLSANEEGEDVVFLAGYDGLFRTTAGAPWQAVETLTEYIVGLGISPTYSKDDTVAVTTYVKGAYISVNGGANWTEIDEGLEHELSAGNKYAPIRRLHNVQFSPNYAKDRTIFSATWDRFIRSKNRGKSWEQILVEPKTGRDILRQFVIGISPRYISDRTIYLGTRQGEIYRSQRNGDAGTWFKISDIKAKVRTIVFTPNFPADPVMYASTDKGVFVSSDQGKTWKRTGPKSYGMLAISPGYEIDGTVLAGTLEGLFITKDKGQTWSELNNPPLKPSSRVEALAISPDFANDKTILMSLGGVGLFKSKDGGDSFRAVGADLLMSSHIVADFTNPTSQPLQFSPTFAKDHTVYGFAGQDVVRSTTGGESWNVLALPSAEDFLKSIGAGPPKASEISTGKSELSPSVGATKTNITKANGTISTTRITRRRAALLMVVTGGLLGLVGLGLGFGGGSWYWRRRLTAAPSRHTGTED